MSRVRATSNTTLNELKAAKKAFVLYSGSGSARSRLLIPFLRKKGPGRDYIISEIAKKKRILLNLGYSAEEFELFGDLDFSDLEKEAVQYQLPNLVVFLARRYKLKINFCFLDQDLSIPEQLLQCLGNEKIATCYLVNVDLETMLKQGIIPCPEVETRADAQFYNYRQVLEYYYQGLSEKEIYFWTGVKNPYAFIDRSPTRVDRVSPV